MKRTKSKRKVYVLDLKGLKPKGIEAAKRAMSTMTCQYPPNQWERSIIVALQAYFRDAKGSKP